QRYTDAIEPLLTPLSMPVHLMWGEQDAWIPLQQGRTLADKLGVELQVVPNAGHLVQEDAPEAIVAALLSMS
ncbi:MAG: alpha/beta hydrolase, partial [Pseudomonadota bacterium]